MDENLKFGDVGDRVIILQEKLRSLGFYKTVITGSFGRSTEVGVKAFQKEEGLEENGVVDSETWEALVRATESEVAPISVYPNLSLGSSGEYVTDLQTKLKALLYYPLEVNGNFDLETETAVKRFQLNNGLTADGIVGSRTWNLLNSLYGNLNDCAISDGEEESGDEVTYTVVSGDTLYSIAKRYNTSVDAIKILNNLTSNTLQIGQVLKIPTRYDDNYIKYTVVSGDTLYSIARRYDTTVDDIKSLNNLVTNILQVGQVLIIPTKNQDDYISYVVQSGDTLYSIARRYNTSVDTLKIINNLTSNDLLVGQVLKIPTEALTNYITYTVVRGDTLYSIAKRYDTTVDDIKSLNNLTNNNLSIGQVLRIPV